MLSLFTVLFCLNYICEMPGEGRLRKLCTTIKINLFCVLRLFTLENGLGDTRSVSNHLTDL